MLMGEAAFSLSPCYFEFADSLTVMLNSSSQCLSSDIIRRQGQRLWILSGKQNKKTVFFILIPKRPPILRKRKVMKYQRPLFVSWILSNAKVIIFPWFMNAQSCPFLSTFNTVPTLSPIAFPFGQRPLVPLQGRGVERPSLIPKP